MTITEKKRLRSPSQPVGRWIRVDKRLAIYLRDGFKCQLCQRNLCSADPREITLDHYVPKARGGSNEETNVFTCCINCNSSRQTKPLGKAQERRVVGVLTTDLGGFRKLAKSLLRGDDYGKSFKAVQRHAKKAA